jgi:putative FmdB family regulatory protein
MPTYVYACTNPDCRHQFEAVQAFTDDALTVCPVCGQRLRKVFGSVGVVFKGSGFYRNDSREKNGSAKTGPSEDKAGSPTEPAKAGASSDAGGASSAKSDTAPAKANGSGGPADSSSKSKSAGSGSASGSGSTGGSAKTSKAS